MSVARPVPVAAIAALEEVALTAEEKAVVDALVAGAKVLTGSTEPAAELGAVDDIYLRTGASWTGYGPKTSEGWGAGVSFGGSSGGGPKIYNSDPISSPSSMTVYELDAGEEIAAGTVWHGWATHTAQSMISYGYSSWTLDDDALKSGHFASTIAGLAEGCTFPAVVGGEFRTATIIGLDGDGTAVGSVVLDVPAASDESPYVYGIPFESDSQTQPWMGSAAGFWQCRRKPGSLSTWEFKWSSGDTPWSVKFHISTYGV